MKLRLRGQRVAVLASPVHERRPESESASKLQASA